MSHLKNEVVEKILFLNYNYHNIFASQILIVYNLIVYEETYFLYRRLNKSNATFTINQRPHKTSSTNNKKKKLH